MSDVIQEYPMNFSDHRNTKRKVFFYALLGCGLALLVGCSGSPEEAQTATAGSPVPDLLRMSPEAIAAAGIKTEMVARTPIPVAVELSGRVTYDEGRYALVSSPVGGRVQRFLKHVGDPVKKGEPLAYIENPEIGQAQSDYLRALAERAVEEKAFERATSLLEKKGLSRSEFQKREGAFHRAEAAVQEAANHLKVLGFSEGAIEQLAETKTVQPAMPLIAPLSGVVVRHEAFTGAGVEPTQMLYLVADLSVVWVEADLYERDIGRVSEGQPAEVRVQAYPDRLFSGRVEVIGRALEEKTRTLMVRVVVPNRQGSLKPGMLAQARILTGTDEEAVTVPTEAVQRDGSRLLVFVEKEPGVFSVRDVTVGQEAGGRMEIKKGVEPGEKVVTTGSFRLKSEMKKAEMEAG